MSTTEWSVGIIPSDIFAIDSIVFSAFLCIIPLSMGTFVPCSAMYALSRAVVDEVDSFSEHPSFAPSHIIPVMLAAVRLMALFISLCSPPSR